MHGTAFFIKGNLSEISQNFPVSYDCGFPLIFAYVFRIGASGDPPVPLPSRTARRKALKISPSYKKKNRLKEFHLLQFLRTISQTRKRFKSRTRERPFPRRWTSFRSLEGLILFRNNPDFAFTTTFSVGGGMGGDVQCFGNNPGRKN